MRKFRTRVLVGTAVATFAGAATFAAVSIADAGPAASGPALTTTASTALTAQTAVTAKTGTTLSITVARPTIKAGQFDIIRGTLTTGSLPSGRRIVELYRYNAKTKKWVPVRVKLTHKGGTVRFVGRPRVTAEYELVYHGNAKLAASHSSPVTVTVAG
jgi:hypothetical protein